jgi:RNA polymerase sigma-70 factor (ECF subfamily)
LVADRERRRVVAFPGRDDRNAARDAPEILTFEEALAAHVDALYATALRLTRDAGLAEDLVQDCALKAYRSFRDLRSHDRFRAWLFTILVNTAKNRAREAARRVPFVDVDLDALLEDPLLADQGAASPETALLQESLPEDLEAGLRSLPGPLLNVLWLVDVEEFRLAEVAAMLGVPPGTVASRLHRARRFLRERLTAAPGRPPDRRGGDER